MAKFPFQDWIKKKKESTEVESWQENIEKKSKHSFLNLEKISNKLLFFSLVIFFAGLIAFAVSLYFTSERVKGLIFEVSGPEKVSALTPTQYLLKISNKSNKTLTNVSLEISLSEGVFFYDQPQTKNLIISLGDLKPEEFLLRDYNLVFFGEENKIEDIEVTLNYNVENKPQVFSERKKISVRVSNTPISIRTFVPKAVFTQQIFELKFEIENEAKIPFNLQFELEEPAYFVRSNATPTPVQDLIWYFQDLSSQQKKEIKISGSFSKTPPAQFFNYKVKIEWQNIEYTPPAKLVHIAVKESPVLISIISSPADESVEPGSNISYRITVENKGITPIFQPEIKVKFLEGPFDLSSIGTDGYFSLIDETILWNSRNKPELYYLDPGEKLSFDFRVRLLKDYPILGEKNKDFTATIMAEFLSKSIPGEVKVDDQVFQVQSYLTKKIIGNMIADHQLTYQSEYFSGSGPFPIEPETETTVTWLIKIKTISEDFEDIVLEANLPLGVDFLNQVGGDADLNNVFYDNLTGNFSYQIDFLKANLGYLYNEFILAFRLKIKPPANTNQNFLVVRNAKIQAKSTFTGKEVNYFLGNLTIRDISP